MPGNYSEIFQRALRARVSKAKRGKYKGSVPPSNTKHDLMSQTINRAGKGDAPSSSTYTTKG